jgi:tetratricopeptide (TPR) repeat protein
MSQDLLERARQPYEAGSIAYHAGKYTEAQKYYTQSLALYRQAGDKRGIAWSLAALADITRHVGSDTEQGPFDRIAELRSEALPFFREIDDKSGIAYCLRLLALLADHEQAREMLNESLTLTTEAQDTIGMGWSLFALSKLAAQEGNSEKAEQLQERAKSLFQDKKEKTSLAGIKLREGIQAACLNHDYDRANALYEEALLLFREVHHPRGVAQTLMALDSFSGVSRPPVERRIELLTEAIVASQVAGIRDWEAGCYVSLIEIAQEQGDVERVAALRAESVHLEAEIKEDEAMRAELAQQDESWEDET